MTTTAPGWYDDPADPSLARYWDGTGWTANTVARHPGATPAPLDQHGPNSATHWLAPVGRSWQSIAAGYLGLVCLVAWLLGPVGVIVGGVTLWFGVWGLRRARTGGHGRGRSIFGIIAGSVSALVGAAATVLLLVP